MEGRVVPYLKEVGLAGNFPGQLQGTYVRCYVFTVQITHNLNNTHMGHVCAVRVTRVAFYCCGFTRVQI